MHALHSAFHPDASQHHRIFLMFLHTKDETEQLVSCRTRQTVSQRENIAGSSPKNIDRASLLSQAVYRNAEHVWGARAAHQAHTQQPEGL